jgi:predicted dehydrogenase
VTPGIQLAIDVSSDLAATCRAMAARSRAVQLVQDENDCAALLTDSVDSATSAANAGRKVLLLNPLTLSTETCQYLQDSNATMPAHTSRFKPSIQQVKRALDAGKLGEPGLLRIHCWNADVGNTVSAVSELDLALWMFGGRPVEIFALERPGYLQIHLGFNDAGMAIIDFDSASPGGNEYYSLSMIGSTGAAYADDHHNMNLLLNSGGTSTLLTPQRDSALAATIDCFATAVRDGGEFSPNWRDTLAAKQAGTQVRESIEQHAVVAGGTDV